MQRNWVMRRSWAKIQTSLSMGGGLFAMLIGSLSSAYGDPCYRVLGVGGEITAFCDLLRNVQATAAEANFGVCHAHARDVLPANAPIRIALQKAKYRLVYDYLLKTETPAQRASRGDPPLTAADVLQEMSLGIIPEMLSAERGSSPDVQLSELSKKVRQFLPARLPPYSDVEIFRMASGLSPRQIPTDPRARIEFLMNAISEGGMGLSERVYDGFVARHDLGRAPPAIAINYNNRPRNITALQFRAIDGVARTIWNEANGCPNQVEAVGRVIADRMDSVTNDGVRRVDRPDLHLAEKVISHRVQFSGWNSVRPMRINLSEFLGTTGSERAIVPVPPSLEVLADTQTTEMAASALCPRISQDRAGSPRPGGRRPTSEKQAQTDATWLRSLELAKSIVLDREQFRQRYQFSPLSPNNQRVYYFTHDGKPPFAGTRPIAGIRNEMLDMSVRPPRRIPFQGGASVEGCSRFGLYEEIPRHNRPPRVGARAVSE